MKIKIITLPLIIASCEAWTWGGVVNGVKDAVINMDLSTLVHQFFGNVLDVPFCRVSWYDLPENKVVTQSFDEEDEDGIVFEKTRTYKRNFYAGKQAAFKFCFNRDPIPTENLILTFIRPGWFRFITRFGRRTVISRKDVTFTRLRAPQYILSGRKQPRICYKVDFKVPGGYFMFDASNYQLAISADIGFFERIKDKFSSLESLFISRIIKSPYFSVMKKCTQSSACKEAKIVDKRFTNSRVKITLADFRFLAKNFNALKPTETVNEKFGKVNNAVKEKQDAVSMGWKRVKDSYNGNHHTPGAE